MSTGGRAPNLGNDLRGVIRPLAYFSQNWISRIGVVVISTTCHSLLAMDEPNPKVLQELGEGN